MRLKKLELSGFKSFGRKTELVFTAPISVIVGPNGSGKSNIAEAMRFVLGEQSLKSMRGKRGEDMIWNGSTDVARAGRASVTVFFDNTDRIFNTIDFNEVIIKRIVHRDGINEYFINNSRVRLKDIIEILASLHIGASSHHIISQGESDRILNASITDRRGMIEDALGLKIYHYKKAESEKKLEKTDENIKEVNILRREIAPHIKFLKKQVDRIEKARATRDELVKKYQEYFSFESSYLSSARAALDIARRAPEERLKEIKQSLENARKLGEHGKAALNEGALNEIIEIERQINMIREKKDADSRELGRLEGIIEYQMKSAERRAHQETQVPFREVRKLSQDIYYRIETAETMGDLALVKKTLKIIRDMIADFIARYRFGGEDEYSEARPGEIKELKERAEKLKKNIIEKNEQEEKMKTRAETFRNEIDKKKDISREAERNIFKLIAEETSVRAELSSIAAREEVIIRDEEEFKRELGEAAVIAGRMAVEFQKKSDIFLETDARSAQNEQRRVIEKLKIRIEEYGGGSGEEIIKEYDEIYERDKFLERELSDLEKTALSLREMILHLEERLNTEFKEGVVKINKQFQEFFSMLFGGGTASLDIVSRRKKRRIDVFSDNVDVSLNEEYEDEKEEGLDIAISLPRKKIRGLQMLSGGERALTSIALLFSISQVNPPPFLVLDETDAALDEANSIKYGKMIETLSEKSQLVVITHNRGTMAHAGILYGVTMGNESVSKLLSIKFDDFINT